MSLDTTENDPRCGVELQTWGDVALDNMSNPLPPWRGWHGGLKPLLSSAPYGC